MIVIWGFRQRLRSHSQARQTAVGPYAAPNNYPIALETNTKKRAQNFTKFFTKYTVFAFDKL